MNTVMPLYPAGPESLLILGWSIPQWRKAIEYHNQLNPQALFGRRVHEIADDCFKPEFRRWADLQTYWRSRRIDQPLESTILTLEAVGARPR